MELQKFLNKYVDWEKRLRAKPYCLDIKKDGNFVIFKYNMIDSDLSLPICREARGSIFICEHNEWRCVCRSLDKFGNWGESYAATKKIDWSKPVSVQEKVDGSIIRIWCYKNNWHISTNGTIDAFKAECGDSTYGLVFLSIFLNSSIEMVNHFCTQDSLNEIFQQFNPLYTYWFEMVHPQYNQIVVHYKEPAIYFLGCRNMVTMEENCNFILNCNKKIGSNYSNTSPKNNPSIAISFSNSDKIHEKEVDIYSLKFNPHWLRQPKQFYFNNLDDVLRACHNMGEDEEGYVVCAYEQMEDDSFLRIKCKGDEYLKRHKLRGNGPLTITKVASLWQTDTLDDFLAYFPEHTDFVNGVIKKIKDMYEKADIAYDVVKGLRPRRDFALHAQTYIKPIQGYLFARLDEKVECACEYFKQMSAKNLAALLEVNFISK